MKFKTLGCRLNIFETETIRSITKKNRFKDFILVNTCAVTQEATRSSKKYVRQLKRKYPNKKMVATGCDVQINPEKYEAMDEVNIILGNSEKLSEATWEKISNSNEKKQKFHKEHKDIGLLVSKSVPNFTNRSRAYLEIQNGCDHSCTFCIIPQGRGRSRSTPLKSILGKVKSFIEMGFQEIMLTGVDITAWGKDIEERKNLGDLIELILSENPSLKRLRLSSLDVSEIDEKLIRLLKKECRLMPHLHLSLQSGNNLVLKRMKRRHSREEAIELCSKLKEARPELTFGADLIAGFPTESEDMFNDTLKLISDCDITWLHIFPYSSRIGTPSSRMPQVERDIIIQRAKTLRKKAAERKKMHFFKLANKKISVLMETEFKGRAEDFSEIKVNKALVPGEIYQLTVDSHDTESLIARNLN